jgi:hypothetical protein
MLNDPASISTPVVIVDDVASEALTLGLLCHTLGVETISAAEAGDILTRLCPAAIVPDLVIRAPTVWTVRS